MEGRFGEKEAGWPDKTKDGTYPSLLEVNTGRTHLFQILLIYLLLFPYALIHSNIKHLLEHYLSGHDHFLGLE